MSGEGATSLTPALRRTVVAAVMFAALPLLLTLPTETAAGIIAVGFATGWSALRRTLPAWLLLALVVAVCGAVLVGFGFRVGRDAGSALLLAMLVLKLAELRGISDARRAVAYALFAPFAAFLQDQGPLTLSLGLAATLATLFAMARLARGLQAPPPPLREEAVALRNAVLLALPLALVGFWLFPRLPTPLWGLPENALARTGIGESMSPGDWIDLLADDSPAFRVRFEGPTPPSTTLYWRGPVLTVFDGRRWTRDSGLATRPAVSLPEGPVAVRYTMTMEPTERRHVFALESPTGWPSDLALGSDASLQSREPLRSVAQFRLAAVAPGGFERDLPSALRAHHLALPTGFNPRTLELAARWREEAGDDRAYVRRVLAWFNAEHAYSISAPPLGRHTADEFLFETREGFCEHFSSAFVILMRAAGIPARVVTGYTGGVPNRVGGFWVVRQMDAHAWAEVWLPGEGWMRVDPTAAVAPERIFDTIDDAAGAAGAVGAALRPVFDFGDSLREAWNNFVVAYDAVRQAQLLRDLGWRGAGAEQVGLAFVIAAGIALGLTLLVLLRPGAGERDPLLRAWRQFLRRLARRGIAKHADESASAFLERLRRDAPLMADDAAPLIERFIAHRYADGEPHALLADLQRYRP